MAEDPDGFQDDDGCPEVDNDSDGIADVDDKCPLRPEDKNGIDDADGCPDNDDDKDGILGSKDKCPDQPETKNGIKDDDGCPDELPPEVKRFSGVIQGINFKLRSADLLRNSLPLLDRAVEVLKTYPEIKLEISGHTDNRGKADFNRDLSQKRAEAVRNYLISRGIAAERIVAVGYGLDKPIADNKTESGRSKNRRTEFRILSGGVISGAQARHREERTPAASWIPLWSLSSVGRCPGAPVARNSGRVGRQHARIGVGQRKTGVALGLAEFQPHPLACRRRSWPEQLGHGPERGSAPQGPAHRAFAIDGQDQNRTGNDFLGGAFFHACSSPPARGLRPDGRLGGLLH